MSEALQAAKKENAALRKRSEECDVAVVRYATQNAQLSTDLAAALQQRSRLEELCRALQARTSASASATSSSSANGATTTSGGNDALPEQQGKNE